jgi:phosphoenolpyruvate-protein kinase (PTS system EI component)
MAARARAAARDEAERHHETVTRDGHAVRVLVNAATAAEARAGLQAGADGAGLVRTELAFLDAPAWPDEAAHRHALAPVLDALRGHTATVRVLDFGGDKTPPFLDGERRRGLSLLLDAPAVLADQLRAILDAGRDTGLRVLLPMVETPVQLLAAHDVLLHAVWRVPGATRPPLGAMVETPQAAANAYRLALRADFLSIGTNDLAHATLGSDRFGTGRASAHHPRVLRLIARTVAAARVGGVVVEVCGEAASDPVAMPLLVGLGVDELSVGAARVAAVRRWVRALEKGEASRLAERALHAADAVEVEALVAGLSDRLRSLGQAGDDLDEAGDGVGRPVPLGGQP